MSTINQANTQTSTSTNAQPNALYKILSPYAEKMGITGDEYYSTLVESLFSNININRASNRLPPLEITATSIVRLMTRCNTYGIDPLMGHVYAIERNGFVSYDLTINGWIHVLLNHQDVKNYSFTYSDQEVPAKEIEGHTVPRWISCNIEFNSGRVFEGVRVYYYEEVEATAAWEHRPTRILAGRAVAQSVRYGLQITITDDDEMTEVVEVPQAAPEIIFDDDLDNKAESEAKAKVEAEAEAEAKAKAEAEAKAKAEAEAKAKAEAEAKAKAEAEAKAKAEAEAKAKAESEAKAKAEAEAKAKAEAEAKAKIGVIQDVEIEEIEDEDLEFSHAKAEQIVETELLERASLVIEKEGVIDYEAQYKAMLVELSDKYDNGMISIADNEFRKFIANQNTKFADFNEVRLEKAHSFIEKVVRQLMQQNNNVADSNRITAPTTEQSVVNEEEYDFSCIQGNIKNLIERAAEQSESTSSIEPLEALLTVLESPIEQAFIRKTIKELNI
ncbi:TPA: cell envelope integrity protein TolA [Photobacterium damselae]